MKIKILLIAFLTMTLLSISSAWAAKPVLKGGVRVTGEGQRLARPGGESESENIPVAPSRFAGKAQAGTSLVDPSLFAAVPARDTAPLSGSALQNSQANAKFDIGAERSSRTLTLAWEAWHKQLSAEIYARWQEIAMVRGRAAMKVTVTRDRRIISEITQPSGKPGFDRILTRVIDSLQGNPGLAFPTGSQRQTVSFEADYIADTNVKGGYSWTKGDYENIRQDN